MHCHNADTSTPAAHLQSTRRGVSYSHVPINRHQSSAEPSATTVRIPLTYSSLRNMVTAESSSSSSSDPSAYKSPFADFFSNLEAGRTSLGTTADLERRAFEMQEKKLDCGVPESALRFRTRSYERSVLPPYVEAGEHRVVVKLAVKDIPFGSEREREVFLEMVGPRYRPKTDEVQLSSEKFASRVENKRYLVDMIERLVESSRGLAREFDEEEKLQA